MLFEYFQKIRENPNANRPTLYTLSLSPNYITPVEIAKLIKDVFPGLYLCPRSKPSSNSQEVPSQEVWMHAAMMIITTTDCTNIQQLPTVSEFLLAGQNQWHFQKRTSWFFNSYVFLYHSHKKPLFRQVGLRNNSTLD